MSSSPFRPYNYSVLTSKLASKSATLQRGMLSGLGSKMGGPVHYAASSRGRGATTAASEAPNPVGRRTLAPAAGIPPSKPGPAGSNMLKVVPPSELLLSAKGHDCLNFPPLKSSGLSLLLVV